MCAIVMLYVSLHQSSLQFNSVSGFFLHASKGLSFFCDLGKGRLGNKILWAASTEANLSFYLYVPRCLNFQWVECVICLKKMNANEIESGEKLL